jgi:pheromone shutdown-related protein TraB
MIVYKNLTLVGTSHISKESKKQVVQTIVSSVPQFVAIELDKNRLKALLSNKKKGISIKDVARIGIRGFLFALAGSWVQNRLAKMVGTKPGAEMKAAVVSAAKVKARVALIDQDITVTIKKLFKTITFREYFRIVWDVVKSPFVKNKEVISFDLNKVPSEETIEKMVGLVKDRYPSIYKVLIHDRNVYMARRLIKLMNTHPEDKIVAVIGAGHQKGMLEIIKKAIV